MLPSSDAIRLCSLKNTVCSTASAIFSFARLSPAKSVVVLKADDTI